MSKPIALPRLRRHPLTVAVSAALMSSGAASGQVLEEVIVTATKREEGVMEVPLAISALSGNFISETNLNDVKDGARRWVLTWEISSIESKGPNGFSQCQRAP